MLDRIIYFSTLGLSAYLATTFAPQQHVFLYVCGYVFAHTCFYRIAVAELFDENGTVEGLKLLATRPVRLVADIVILLAITQGSIHLTIATVQSDAQYALILGYMLAFALAYNKLRAMIFPEDPAKSTSSPNRL